MGVGIQKALLFVSFSVLTSVGACEMEAASVLAWNVAAGASGCKSSLGDDGLVHIYIRKGTRGSLALHICPLVSHLVHFSRVNNTKQIFIDNVLFVLSTRCIGTVV